MLVLLAAAVVIVFGTEISRLTVSLPGEQSPYYWPLLGLAVGLALAIEIRYWPWFVVALIAIDLPTLDRDYYSFDSTLGFVAEYASYYVVVIGGCWILRRRHPDGPDLARLSPDLRDFLLAAVLIAAATGAIEPLFRFLADDPEARLVDWYGWFALDLMSILVVAPFIGAWRTWNPRQRRLGDRKALIELGAFAAAAFAIFFFELYGPPGDGRTNFDFIWLLVLWAIFRFDLRIVTTVVLFTATYVSARTTLDDDGFKYVSHLWQDQSLIVTTYICVSVTVALILNSLRAYTRQQRTEFDEARTYLDSLIRETGSYLWVYNVADRRYEYFSDTVTGHWTDHIGMDNPPGNIFNYLHPGDDRTAKPVWNRILNGDQQKPFNFSYRLVNAEGDVRWDRNIGIPLIGDDGTVERYVGMILDITDEQQLRAERNRLHDVIRESEKLHAIGALSAGMAHDWNNLLLVLSMEASRLGDLAGERPELQESVASLNQIVEEGRGITDELMSLARREREPTAICNLYEEIHKGADLLSRAVPANITITTEFDATARAPVRCKVTHLIQIILNLGLNARDAIGERRGSVTVRLEGPHAGIIGDRQLTVATLQVVDDGKGIPAAQIDRILEPLYTTKARRGGTGLGLSVVNGFVAEMDGEMTIDSEEGSGTTVTVVLPVVTDLQGQ